MKAQKLLFILFIAGIVLTLGACKKCKNQDPSARIINNGTGKATVQIKTSNGNTVNINNVDPGTSSPYSSYAAGVVTFTITINGSVIVKEFQLGQCFNYDIKIDSNNNVTSTPFDRNS